YRSRLGGGDSAAQRRPVEAFRFPPADLDRRCRHHAATSSRRVGSSSPVSALLTRLVRPRRRDWVRVRGPRRRGRAGWRPHATVRLPNLAFGFRCNEELTVYRRRGTVGCRGGLLYPRRPTSAWRSGSKNCPTDKAFPCVCAITPRSPTALQ